MSYTPITEEGIFLIIRNEVWGSHDEVRDEKEIRRAAKAIYEHYSRLKEDNEDLEESNRTISELYEMAQKRNAKLWEENERLKRENRQRELEAQRQQYNSLIEMAEQTHPNAEDYLPMDSYRTRLAEIESELKSLTTDVVDINKQDKK